MWEYLITVIAILIVFVVFVFRSPPLLATDIEGNENKNEKVINASVSEPLVENVKPDRKKKDFSNGSFVELKPEFDDLNDLVPVLFPDDDHFKCLVYVPGDFQTPQKSLSSDKLTVSQYKRQINVEVKKLSDDFWEATVPLKFIQPNEKGKAKLRFTFQEAQIPFDLYFTVYEEFDKGTCQKMSSKSRPNQEAFNCDHVSALEIEGADKYHLENITRVCSINEPKSLKVKDVSNAVCLTLPAMLDGDKVEKCRKLLLNLLEAIYCRKKASEMNEERIKWKEKAMEKHAAKYYQQSSFCKSIKQKYSNLMNYYNDKACEKIFAFFNEDRGLYHVDLHGLSVVDDETLARDKEELLKDTPEEEVTKIIEERQEQGDEAIRMLKKKIEEFMKNMGKARSENKTWLEVIVGAGHHSICGRQKIKPKVLDFLKEVYPNKVSDVNEGSLVVTFEEYPNNARCFGHYYCKKCKKDWKSGRSYKNKWQGCNWCFDQKKELVKCFPVMQCPLSKLKLEGVAKHVDHCKALCQVCYEGGSCV